MTASTGAGRVTDGRESAGGPPRPGPPDGTAEDAGDSGTTPPADDTPWRRLSVRVVSIDLLRLAVSVVPGYVGIVVLNDDGPVWPLVIGSALGVLSALLDFRRWVTTRYRVTPDRVELRTGWLVRKYHSVPRDRVRSVDSSAKALHRLFAVRVVHIGSGESDASVKLDALTHAATDQLQDELMSSVRRRRGQSATRAAGTADEPAEGPNGAAPKPAGQAGPEQDAAPEPPEPETVIARLQPRWVKYNIVTIWAAFIVAGPLFGAYWFFRPFGVDLLDIAGDLLDWQAIGLFWSIVICVAVAFPFGVAGLAVAFVLENWRFTLARVGTPPATALVTRRGLLNTHLVQRDDRRLRGLAFQEPLIWRWLPLAETKVITTGLGQSGGSAPAAKILPRIPLAEARALVPEILPDGEQPMTVPLGRHPRGALTRRLIWALWGPALACGVLFLFGRSGAVPDWWWRWPPVVLPVTLILGLAGYLALGHALAGPYLVIRHGSLNRHTVALQKRAVIGWSVQQSILQRRGGRMTIGIATAAGDRYYRAPDAGVQQALAFITDATPELAAQFIATTGKPPRSSDPPGRSIHR